MRRGWGPGGSIIPAFGTGYLSAVNEATFSTTSETPQTALTLSLPADTVAGVYRVSWNGEISATALLASAACTVDIDGASPVADLLYNTTLISAFSHVLSGFVDTSLGAGAHTVTMKISRSGGLGSDQVSIRRRRLSCYRIS